MTRNAVRKTRSALCTAITGARNRCRPRAADQQKRDALYTGLWDKAKRVRSTVKGIYGDDSSEYEMVGGTRKSERKRPVRQSPASQP